MTPVGKILVFVNLVFSLFVGAMGLMVFTADTNKNTEIVKVQREREVLKASNTTYQEENKSLQEDKASSGKEKEVEIAKSGDEGWAQVQVSTVYSDGVVADGKIHGLPGSWS